MSILKILYLTVLICVIVFVGGVLVLDAILHLYDWWWRLRKRRSNR